MVDCGLHFASIRSPFRSLLPLRFIQETTSSSVTNRLHGGKMLIKYFIKQVVGYLQNAY